MNITVDAKKVEIDPNYDKSISVELMHVDETQLLDHFSILEIISHFEIDKILDEIGEDACIDYFNIDVITD